MLVVDSEADALDVGRWRFLESVQILRPDVERLAAVRPDSGHGSERGDLVGVAALVVASGARLPLHVLYAQRTFRDFFLDYALSLVESALAPLQAKLSRLLGRELDIDSGQLVCSCRHVLRAYVAGAVGQNHG